MSTCAKLIQMAEENIRACQEAVNRGEILTVAEARHLEALSRLAKEFRNYAICADPVPNVAAAKRYGVSQARISQIRAGGIPMIFRRPNRTKQGINDATI